jgi:predicted protein tyrosine phosphatase
MVARPPDLDWIVGDLAVGGCFPAGHAAALARRHGIGAVVDVRVEACDDARELAACGIRFLHLPTEDLQGVSQPMLDEGVAFARQMAAHGRKLLIHCTHGIGRSATLALCVLADRGFGPLEALNLAKDARSKISPSLAQYEAWAAWLRRGRPEAEVPTYHEFGCIAYRHLAMPA